MRRSWWRQPSDLDEAQQKVILLPADGQFLLTGPPGSGKTNLLLLRAKFLSSSGQSDVLFLTVGRTLQEFIVTGAGSQGLIAADQILTLRKWTMKHIAEHSPAFMKNQPTGSYAETQLAYAAQLEKVNKNLSPIYKAILIDEVQDLTRQELFAIARLTKRLLVAGDDRQQIFQGDGIAAALELGLTHIDLQYHYRIGKKICEAADSVLPPLQGQKPLTQTCNYDEAALPSSRKLVSSVDLDAQIDSAIEEIRLQLRAYPGEALGILVPRNSVLADVRSKLEASDLSDLCEFHETGAEASREFPEEKRIFVMTIHSAKGTEFRAVHILGGEQLKMPLATRKLIFTAFTRAKTSLAVYYSGKVPPYIQSALSNVAAPRSLAELF
jgi:superfamily I DNA/RNA helicase